MTNSKMLFVLIFKRFDMLSTKEITVATYLKYIPIPGIMTYWVAFFYTNHLGGYVDLNLKLV